jgi:predicted NBD/HSP70 family sugar kinase
VDRSRVLGVGIAAPGPVDLDRGVVLDPPLLEGWHGVALRDALSQGTGLRVLLEKDVTAAAVAELWTSKGHERDNFVFFYYGTGVGVGLVLGHEAVRGSTSNAGDAGHIMIDPAGPKCTCGRRGCLGDSVIPRRLVELAIERGVFESPGRSLDTGLVDECFTSMAKLADAGDTQASLILDEMARRVAAAIVTIVNLLDVDRVVFGGPFWERVSGFLLQRLPELINSSSALATTHPIVVNGSTIGDDVAAVGAACLVLESALSPRPSTLLISV